MITVGSGSIRWSGSSNLKIGEGTMMNKIKDFFCHLLFVLAFVFVASGMLECCILKLLEVLGW